MLTHCPLPASDIPAANLPQGEERLLPPPSPILTTASARSCHVLAREDKAGDTAVRRKKPLLVVAQHLYPKANPESGDAIRLRGQGLALGYDSWRELGCEVFLRMVTEQHIRGGSGISEPILWRLFRNKRNWLQLCLITVPCGAHTLVASTECEPAL